MTSTETLLPCPFCGAHCADLMIDQGGKWAHYEPGCLEVRTGYNTRLDAPWRDEAIAAWNHRTPPTPAGVNDEHVEPEDNHGRTRAQRKAELAGWPILLAVVIAFASAIIYVANLWPTS